MAHEGTQRGDRGDGASMPQENRECERMRSRQARFDIGDAQRSQRGEERRQVGCQRSATPQHPDERKSDEEAAHRRSGNGREPGDAAPDAEGCASPLGREDRGQDREGLGGEQRAADRLHHAGRDQLVGVLGQAAGDGGQREDRQAEREEVALPEAVCVG